jgi:hypothetical protein
MLLLLVYEYQEPIIQQLLYDTLLIVYRKNIYHLKKFAVELGVDEDYVQ